MREAREAPRPRRRRRLVLSSYLASLGAFVGAYLAFLAGTNGYHRDAWTWGLLAAVLAVTAVFLFRRSGTDRPE